MTNAYLFPGSATSVVEITGPYTLGVEFEVSKECWLTGIGAWRSSTAVNPTVGRVWEVTSATTGSPVAGSDVTFALSGTGWQTGRPTTPPKLVPGKRYRAGVFFPDKGPKTDNYWTTAITREFLTAPTRANATGQMQGSYSTATSLAYPPAGNANAPNYWIDVLLTDVDPAAPQPGPDSPIFGCDVSRWQPGFPMAAAKADGMTFVVAKIGQGASADGTRGAIVDPEWNAHRAAARAAQLPLGGYWYLGDAEAPASQAQRCASQIGDPSIPVALDWEEGGGEWPNVVACVNAFRAAGLTVKILYARKTWYDAHAGTATGIADLGLVLWNARYPSNNGGTPAQLYQAGVAPARSSYWQTYGGVTATILQFSDDSTIGGVTPVDANAFNGTQADVDALFGPATGPGDEDTTPDDGTGGGTYDPGASTPGTGQDASGNPAPEGGTGEPKVDANPPPTGPGSPIGGAGYMPDAGLPEPIDITYTFHFQDLTTGTPTGQLPLVGCKHSIVLGGEAGSLSALINVSDPDVRALNPWAVAVPRRTAVFVRRVEHYPPNTLPDRETVDWGGIVWDLDPLPGTGHLQLKAATPESYFASRYLDEDRSYPQVEQTTIHADLINYFQTYRPGASIRVEAAAIATGRIRDRFYLRKDTKELSTRLTELGEVIDGFDWWIRPYRNTTTGRFGFRVQYGYPRLGRLADGPEGPLRLRWLVGGGGNVVAPPTVIRQGTVVKNEIIALGETTNDVQLRTVVTAEQLGRTELAIGYPLLQTTHSDTNVKDVGVLRENAAAKLRQGWASEVLLTKISILGSRRPTRADVRLGDDVALFTDDLVFPKPTTLSGRVWAMETTCATQDQAEKVELTMAGEGLTV